MAILLVGMGAAGVAFIRYGNAYEWLSHTSEARLAIGRGLSHAEQPPVCAELRKDVAEIQRRTVDLVEQQARIPGLRMSIERACRTHETGDLLGRLVAIDATERDFMASRGQDFAESQQWVLRSLALAAIGATATLLFGGLLQRRRARALSRSEDRFRLFANTSRDLIRFHEPSGQTTYVSPSVTTLLGYTVEEFLATRPMQVIHPDDLETSREVLARVQQPFASAAINLCRMFAKDGTERWFEVHVTPIHDANGQCERLYSTARDITERVELEKRLEAAAIGDELTGLLNRRGFRMLADQQHRLAVRSKQGLAIIYADLDGLKTINDKLGHEHGDRALKQFAATMTSVFRESDIVARLGGDEYAALVCNVTEAQLATVLERLRVAVDASPAIGPYRLAVSIGTSVLAPGDTRSLDSLVSEADTRMYAAKRARKESARKRFQAVDVVVSTERRERRVVVREVAVPASL